MHWYVLNTKPHQEKLAELNLQRQGVETLCPQFKQNKVIRRMRRTVISPLFPGYIFARFNLDTHYRAARYSRGVRKLVAFGLDPAIVDEEVIESIKSRIQHGFITFEPTSFKPGQTVQIQGGPLGGLEAVFEREMSNHQRVVLLLGAISYQARVVVDLQDVVES